MNQEALPYERSGERPELFPGDLVLTNGHLAIVIAARVVIDGTIYYWNSKLPEKHQQANLPSYQLTLLGSDRVQTTWLNAHQLILVERGYAWEHREDLQKEYQ